MKVGVGHRLYARVCEIVREIWRDTERARETERDGEGEKEMGKVGGEGEKRESGSLYGIKKRGEEYDVNVSLNLNKKNVHYRKSTSISDVPSNS